MTRRFVIRLREGDYLNYQLFHASQSAQVKAARRRSVWVVVVIFLVMAVISFLTEVLFWLPAFYLVLALVSVLFYPRYQAWIYRRRYRRFVRENYQASIGWEVRLDFREGLIEMAAQETNSQIQYGMVEAIHEVEDAFYLRLKSTQSLILPKNQVGAIDEAREFLKNLAMQKNIVYKDFPNWKWK